MKLPCIKHTCFNFGDVHWIDLNNDLNNINWDMIIDCYEPEIMWSLNSNLKLSTKNLKLSSNQKCEQTLTLTTKISFTKSFGHM